MRLFLANVNARWMSRRSWLLPLLLIIGLASIGAGAVGGTLVVVDSGGTNDVEQLRLTSPAATVRVFSGTSNPDGLVNGQSIGSMYVRDDGANGGRVYTNNDGNTAWGELARQNDREQIRVRSVNSTTNPNPVQVTDHTIIGDNTSAGVVINLPVASQFPGRRLIVVRGVGAPNTNAVTINTQGGDTIVDETASLTQLVINNTRTFQEVGLVSEAPTANRWRIVGLPYNFTLALTSIVTTLITGNPDLTITARNLTLDTTAAPVGTILLDSGDDIQLSAPNLVQITSSGDDLALSANQAASLTAGDTLLLESQSAATLRSALATVTIEAQTGGSFEAVTGTLDLTTNTDDVNISALGTNSINASATDILNLDGDNGVTIDSNAGDVDITADGSGSFTADTGSLALEATTGNVTIDALGGSNMTATATDAMSINGTNSVSVTSGSGTVDLLAQTSGSFTTTTGTLSLSALGAAATLEALGGNSVNVHATDILNMDGDNGVTLDSNTGDVDISAGNDASFDAANNLTIDAIAGLLDLDGLTADLQGTNGVAIGSAAGNVDVLANGDGSFEATNGTLVLRSPLGILDVDGDTVDVDAVNGVTIDTGAGTIDIGAAVPSTVNIATNGGSLTNIGGSSAALTSITGSLNVSNISRLHSLAHRARTVTGTYNVDSTPGDPDHIICADNSGGGVSVVLPTAATEPGRTLRIARLEQNANGLTIAPQAGDSIEGGAAGAPIVVDNMHIFQEVQLISEGAANNWKIIGVPFTTGLTGSGTITISEIMGNPNLLIDTADLDVDVSGLATVDIGGTLTANIGGDTTLAVTGFIDIDASTTLDITGNGNTSVSSTTGTLALDADLDVNLTSANGQLTLEGEGNSSLTSISGSLALNANAAGQSLNLNANGVGNSIGLDTPALNINTAAASLITIGSSGNDANTILTGNLDVDDLRLNGNTLTTLNATNLVLNSATGTLDATAFTTVSIGGSAASVVNIGAAGNDATTTLVGSLDVDNLSLDGNTLTTTAGDLILNASSGVLDASSPTSVSLGTSATNTAVDIATGAGGANDVNIGGSATDTLDITGVGTVAGEWNVDDLNLDGNTISTDTADLVLESATDNLVATDFASLDLGTATSTLTFNGTTLDAANTDTVNLGTAAAGTSDVNIGDDATDTLDVTGITSLTGTLNVTQLTDLTSLAVGVRVIGVAAGTVNATDHTIIGDTVAAAGAITIDLPAANAVTGRTLTFVRFGPASVTINPAGADTINGGASFVLDNASASNAATFVSDGVADWRLVSTSSTIANLNTLYLRLDGTNAMSANLDLAANDLVNTDRVAGPDGFLDVDNGGTVLLDSSDVATINATNDVNATGDNVTANATTLLTLTGGTVAINGNTTLTGTLNVTSDTTVDGDFTVNGTNVDLGDATSVEIGTAGPGATDTNIGDDPTDTLDVVGRSTMLLTGSGAEALRVDVNRNAGGSNSMAIFAQTIVTNAGSDTRGLLAEGTGDNAAALSTTAGVIASGFFSGTVAVGGTVNRPFVMGSDNNAEPGAGTNTVNAVGARGTAIRDQAGDNTGTLGVGANGGIGRTIGAAGLATTDDTTLPTLFAALDNMPADLSAGLLAVNTDTNATSRVGTLSTIGATGGFIATLNDAAALNGNGTAAVVAYNENTTANNFAIWASGNSRLEGDVTITGALTATSFSGSLSFADLATGTNTAAAMTVDTGASLDFANTGTINASSLDGNTWASPQDIGTGTAADGTFNALTSNTGLTVVAGGAGISGNSSVDGTLDMQSNPIVNIGAVGTDFSATGGLTLADALTIFANGADITGDTVVTGNLNVDDGTTDTFAVDTGTDQVTVTGAFTVTAGAVIDLGITTSVGSGLDLQLDADSGTVAVLAGEFLVDSAINVEIGNVTAATTILLGTGTGNNTINIGTGASGSKAITLGNGTSTTDVVGRLTTNTSTVLGEISANIGNVPHWISFPIPAFSAGAGVETLALGGGFVLPANAVVHAVKIQESGFATGNTTYTFDIGVAGELDRYTLGSMNVITTDLALLTDPEAETAAQAVVMTANADIDRQGVGGTGTVWLLVSVAN